MTICKWQLGFLFVLAAILLGGCVERTIHIESEPQGVLVILNDKEVGRTPCQVEFTWYGSYDVILRKEPVVLEDQATVYYKALHTTRKVKAPWYQWLVLDFFAEALTPWTYHDRHYWAFVLEPDRAPDREALIERARELQDRTLEGAR